MSIPLGGMRRWIIELIIIGVLLLIVAESKDDNPITKNFKCRRNGCCDQHEWCRFWASAGECMVNKKWMEDNCQLACNACKRQNPKVIPTKKTASKIPIPGALLLSKPIASTHTASKPPTSLNKVNSKIIFVKSPPQGTLKTPAFNTRLINNKPQTISRLQVVTRKPTTILKQPPLSRVVTTPQTPNIIKPLQHPLRIPSIPSTKPFDNAQHPNNNIHFIPSHTPRILEKSKIVTTTIQPPPIQGSFNSTLTTPHNKIIISGSIDDVPSSTVSIKLITHEATDKSVLNQNNHQITSTIPIDVVKDESLSSSPLSLKNDTILNKEDSQLLLNNNIDKILLNNSFTLPIDRPISQKNENLEIVLPKSEVKHTTHKVGNFKSQTRTFLQSISSTPPTLHLPKPSHIVFQKKETISQKTTLRPVIQTMKTISTSLQQTTVSPINKSKNVLGSKIESCRRLLSDPTNLAVNIKKDNLVFTAEDNDGRRTLSLDDVIRSNLANACTPRLDDSNCERNLCYNLYFRTMDGTCNNLEKPLQGASYRPYNRLLPPEYDDGLGAPVSSIKINRPSPREINRNLLSSQAIVHADDYNSLLMQFGQFISHDMAKTTLVPSSKCPGCSNIEGRCMAIKLSANETNKNFLREGCIKVSRSSSICGSGRTKPRQQLNENTGYIDGSPIYGSSVDDLHKFRLGKTAFLKLSTFMGQRTLPFDQSRCKNDKNCNVIFIAGDSRVNLFIGLSSIHILFTREHNRIAGIFKRINPQWSDERVFQEARKLVGAQIQAIVYREYLPKILGSAFMTAIGPYKGYNQNVDATIVNEFTSSAFRYGHGMIQETFPRLGENFRNISFGSYNFVKGTLNSQMLVKQGGIDPILRGMMLTKLKRPQRLTTIITENMFESTDLGSINIQRGRDHGLPPYNKFRDLCGLNKARTFEELSKEILSPFTRSKLQKIYGSVDTIDLFVGAILEDPVLHGLIGPTITCIIGPQFKRSRDGDRFYYENPGIFTPQQLKEIRKSSFSRILCDNGDNINLVTKEAFRVSNLTPCTQIPKMDLSKWKE
uniref:peroxidase n=1 Tax=Strongyloides venezuelensis TaxID=75913 RepID=A0A0K0F465_STRVS